VGALRQLGHHRGLELRDHRRVRLHVRDRPENFHPPYEEAVVGEYLGKGAAAGRGNREAYLLALEHAADPAGHAVLEGFAPPGRVLRVRRAVSARTSPVCVTQPTGFFSTPCPATGAPLPFADELSSVREVGPDGVVAWHLNPSDSIAGDDSGAWELTCETADGRVLERRAVRLSRGARVRADLVCGEPPCRATRTLSAVAAMPARGARAVRLGAVRRRGARGRVGVEVLRVARGRRGVPAAVVARLASLPRRGAVLRSARLLRPGAYVVRFRSGGDVRRIAYVVDARGRVRRGPRFATADGCRELRSARLASPVFGGADDRAPRLVVRLAASSTVRVRLARRGRTVASLPPRTVAGGRPVTLRLPGARLGRGAYTVHVSTARGTAEARRESRRVLAARGL
jgi:hypothetical protein